MARELQYTADGLPYYQETDNALPVDQSYNPGNSSSIASLPAELPVETFAPKLPIAPGPISKAYDILTGSNGQERYQLFPERIVRSALSLPTDVMSGKVRTPFNPPATGSEEDYSSDELLQRVQDMAALMGTGGFGMAEKAALGSTGGRLIKPEDFTTEAFHGTPNAGFDKFQIPDAANEYMPDRALGIHVAKDPIIANKFAQGTGSKRGETPNGGVYPVKIPDDSKFLEVDQPLHPYVKDPNTPKMPGNIASDQDAIEKLIYSTVYKKDPEMSARYLSEARAVPEEDALGLAKDMIAGKSVDLPVDGKGWTLDRFIRNFNGKPYNPADRGKAVEIFKKEMKDQGYAGLKYINTSPMETAGATDPTSYIIFDPSKHIKSKYTNTLMSDTTKPGMALAALEKKPAFYSAVENAVNTASLKSAPPQQWLSTISNAKGVKPEELDWTGLKDWLGSQKGSVSKEQVQDFLQQNKVELKEVNKDINDIPKIDVVSDKLEDGTHNLKMQSNSGRIYEADKDEGSGHYDVLEMNKDKPGIVAANLNIYEGAKPETLEEIKNLIISYEGGNNLHSGVISGPKYSKYQLPGGENYREKLLALPKKEAANGETMNDFAKRLAKESGDNWENLGPNGRQQYQNEAVRLETAANGNYKSSHWDEPNILAHIRMNDRFIPDEAGPIHNFTGSKANTIYPTKGYKALHIEEIQSDWHQQGREQGYKITDAQKKQLEQIDNKLTTKLSEGDIGNPDMDAVLKTAIDKKIITSQEAANYKQWSKGENSTIPDAPFKKTWLELAAKRMIREAAEQGKDVLSWTPGEAQAARYDLSKQVDNIKFTRASADTDKGMLTAYAKNGDPVIAKTVDRKDLSDIIGKEAAEKLLKKEFIKINQQYDTGHQILENADLKVGGEGMHYFYDKMLPAVLEKLTGQKMKQSAIGESPKQLKDRYDTFIQSMRDEAKTRYMDENQTPKEKEVAQRMGNRLSKTDDINDLAKRLGKHHELNKITNDLFHAKDKYAPINYIDLPQSVKDTALHKGFPLFSSGLMLSPTDDNPFKKYKLTPVEHNPFEVKKK